MFSTKTEPNYVLITFINALKRKLQNETVSYKLKYTFTVTNQELVQVTQFKCFLEGTAVYFNVQLDIILVKKMISEVVAGTKSGNQLGTNLETSKGSCLGSG